MSYELRIKKKRRATFKIYKFCLRIYKIFRDRQFE